MLKSKKMDLAAVVYIVIIITALKLESVLILPFLMAFFLFIIFLPLANRLNYWKICLDKGVHYSIMLVETQ